MGMGGGNIRSLSLSSLKHIIAWEGGVRTRWQLSYECDVGFLYVVAFVLGHDIAVEVSGHLVIKRKEHLL